MSTAHTYMKLRNEKNENISNIITTLFIENWNKNNRNYIINSNGRYWFKDEIKTKYVITPLNNSNQNNDFNVLSSNIKKSFLNAKMQQKNTSDGLNKHYYFYGSNFNNKKKKYFSSCLLLFIIFLGLFSILVFYLKKTDINFKDVSNYDFNNFIISLINYFKKFEIKNWKTIYKN